MADPITPRQVQIIEAAGKILTRTGVSGLTIKNLALEMGFSEPAIYRHFKSKEDIILAMIQYLAQALEEVYQKATIEEGSEETKLLKLFHHKLQFFKSNPHFAIVVFSDGLLETSQTINEGIRSIMILKTKYLKPIISEAITTGKFKSELEVEDVLHLIMGSLRLQMLKWRMADFSFDIVVAGDRQISNILKLIKK